ncbi:hypothetical protein V8F06_007994 [Rhypophila decipiens]
MRVLPPWAHLLACEERRGFLTAGAGSWSSDCSSFLFTSLALVSSHSELLFLFPLLSFLPFSFLRAGLSIHTFSSRSAFKFCLSLISFSSLLLVLTTIFLLRFEFLVSWELSFAENPTKVGGL